MFGTKWAEEAKRGKRDIIDLRSSCVTVRVAFGIEEAATLHLVPGIQDVPSSLFVPRLGDGDTPLGDDAASGPEG